MSSFSPCTCTYPCDVLVGRDRSFSFDVILGVLIDFTAVLRNKHIIVCVYHVVFDCRRKSSLLQKWKGKYSSLLELSLALELLTLTIYAIKITTFLKQTDAITARNIETRLPTASQGTLLGFLTHTKQTPKKATECKRTEYTESKDTTNLRRLNRSRSWRRRYPTQTR
jgi:hypothetical protein